MAGDFYASGNWRVKEGSREEFVARWGAWLTESAKTVEGFGSARLLQDADDPDHFVSFSDWADGGARDNWKAGPQFAKGFAACKELCEHFDGGDFSQVVSV